MPKLEGKYQTFARFVKEKAKRGEMERLLAATPSKLLLLFPDLASVLFIEVNREAGLVRCPAFAGPKDLITFNPLRELFTFDPEGEDEEVEARLVDLIRNKLHLPRHLTVTLSPFHAAFQLIEGFFVLIFQSDHEFYDATTLEIREVLDYLSLNIENMCLKSQVKELSTSYETIARKLFEETPFSLVEVFPLLKTIQASACQIFQSRFSVLFSRGGNTLRALSHIGDCISFTNRHSEDEPFSITLYEPSTIPDTQVFDAEFYGEKIEGQMKDFVSEDGFEHVLALPIGPFGTCTFIIALFYGRSESDGMEYLQRIAPSFSEVASSSIESALNRTTVSSTTNKLVQEKKKTSDLIHLTNLVSSTLDVEHVLQIATKKVRELFGADRCSIIIMPPDEQDGVIQFSSLKDPSYGDFLGIHLSEDHYPYLFSPSKSKKPILIDDVESLLLNVKERRLLHALKVQRVLIVPVFSHGEFTGLLTIEHMNKDQFFSEEDVEFATAIVNQIAGTVGSARLFTNARRTKNEWELTFNSISEGVFVIDMDYTVTNYNKVFAEKLGVDPHTIIGAKCYDLFSCRKEDTEECGHVKCIRLKKPVETIHEDDSIPGIFRVTISPVFDEHGEVEKSVHFVKDITREVEYETRLKDSLRKAQEISNYLETLIESSPDSIISTDESGKIAYFSSGAKELLGYLPEEICGTHVSEIYASHEEAKKIGKRMEQNGGKVRNHNAFLKKKNGALVEVLLSVSTIYDESGKRVGTVGISKDLSTIKKMEDYIRQSEKLTALGKLASGVAHDFNNILAAISMRAELMRLKIKDEQLLKELEVIEKAAHTGADTVKKLRSFYKREREPYQPVNLNDVIRETIDITAPRWKDMSHSRGISIEVELALDDTLRSIQGKEGELKDAFINLIINSLDAMPKGGRIRIQTQNTDDSVKTTFSDSGVGMKPNIRDRAFEPFFSTKGEKGSGLGLSTVYGIITSHGGKVELESWTGKGTSFIIHLPVTGEREKEASREEEGEKGSIEGTSVIVFEDEETIRESIRELLLKNGCDVIEFDNSMEGIEFLKEHLSSLRSDRKVAVITDFGMPEMNGLEIARKTKGLEQSVPVIMITGWGGFIESSQVDLYGVDRVISKPLRGKTLIDAIAELVG